MAGRTGGRGLDGRWPTVSGLPFLLPHRYVPTEPSFSHDPTQSDFYIYIYIWRESKRHEDSVSGRSNVVLTSRPRHAFIGPDDSRGKQQSDLDVPEYANFGMTTSSVVSIFPLAIIVPKARDLKLQIYTTGDNTDHSWSLEQARQNPVAAPAVPHSCHAMMAMMAVLPPSNPPVFVR